MNYVFAPHLPESQEQFPHKLFLLLDQQLLTALLLEGHLKELHFEVESLVSLEKVVEGYDVGTVQCLHYFNLVVEGGFRLWLLEILFFEAF